MNETAQISLKKVGIILRPSTPELKEVFYRVKQIFEGHGIEVLIDNLSGGMIGVLGQQFDILCRESDLLATIGGDGTLISAVRRSHSFGKPVMGIHAGKLGFLADVALDELDEILSQIKAGEYRIDERAMLQAVITTAVGEKRVVAFNDIVITRPSISKMIHVETFVDGKNFNTYFGDGVIISTPTGSTAYNLSAGGPVLFPLTKVFALTPICPHSLTQRPVVLPGQYDIEVRTPDQSALAVVDGQDMYEFGEGDSIRISLADMPAKLLHRKAFNYFDVLKEKLNWGEG
ncbi:NAD(+)/NADH kinase [Sulfurimonas sp. HSL1-2]|uniref:NAD(+)/NADH kinase n=1 Tax=Thiomicrolovo zhangzhouensis TaxID=3131933 RepID=UPI0031F9AEEB